MLSFTFVCVFVCVCLCFPGERMDTQSQVVDRLRSAFRTRVTMPEQFRQAQLKQLMAMIQENEQLIIDALHEDLAKVWKHCRMRTFTLSDYTILFIQLIGGCVIINNYLPPSLSCQPKFEGVLAEIHAAMNELHCAIANLSSWMKPEYVSKNLVGYSNRCGSLVTLTVVTASHISIVCPAGD